MIKTDYCGEIVVPFRIKQSYLMVSLFCDGVLPLSDFQLVVLSSYFGCAIGLVSGIATKAAIVLSIFSLQIAMVVMLIFS